MILMGRIQGGNRARDRGVDIPYFRTSEEGPMVWRLLVWVDNREFLEIMICVDSVGFQKLQYVPCANTLVRCSSACFGRRTFSLACCSLLCNKHVSWQTSTPYTCKLVLTCGAMSLHAPNSALFALRQAQGRSSINGLLPSSHIHSLMILYSFVKHVHLSLTLCIFKAQQEYTYSASPLNSPIYARNALNFMGALQSFTNFLRRTW